MIPNSLFNIVYIHALASIEIVFFFNDTATTEIYTLSLHDALPICGSVRADHDARIDRLAVRLDPPSAVVTRDPGDRKSTRLNSSHGYISYAVFCLKKKKQSNGHQSREEYSRDTNVRCYQPLTIAAP